MRGQPLLGGAFNVTGEEDADLAVLQAQHQ
jgi:hypothetical protein